MLRRRGRFVALACLLAALVVVRPDVGVANAGLPERLSAEEFWALSTRMSEPGGQFRSDNLLSNELYYPEVLRDLTGRVPAGGVYLGVGPEQNFHYITALKPRLVFITDVRRGNLHLQLMYKALFEMSADRAAFVSRLFTKPRPDGLTGESAIAAVMDAFWKVDTSPRDVFDRNVRELQDHLTRTRGLPLSAADLAGIADVYASFYWFGPSISYGSSSNGGFGRRYMATFYDLMLATDERGVARSFLSTEDTFAVVKTLHERNLIVPVVGDFGGPHALRSIGGYIREHGATVSTFYLSNVEQYLRQSGTQYRFCMNVGSMPLDDRSTFIRSESGGGEFRNMLGAMLSEVSSCLAPVGLTPVTP